MLEQVGQHLLIGVASDGVSIARAHPWWRGPARLLAERRMAAGGNAGDIVQALEELLAAAPPRGANVSIVLADELVRMWPVTPPPGCARMSDLQAAAALRFTALFGASPGAWKIAGQWDAVKPFFAVAAPQPLLSALERAVRAHQGHVVEVVPQLAAALHRWRRMRRPGVWFGVVHANVLTLALFDDAAPVAVRAAAVPHGAGRDWLDAHVARESLRVGVAQPARLLLCGPAPAGWVNGSGGAGFVCRLMDAERGAGLSDPARLACAASVTRSASMNLASPGVRRLLHCTPLAARALALAAIALLPVVATSAGHYAGALRRHGAALASPHVRQQAPAVHKTALPAGQPTPAQASAVNAAIMQLNLPWRALHDAVIEATPPGVAMLALEPDAKKHVLRITAEAKTSDDMIGYVEKMKEQDRFEDVAIVRHEINEQDPNHPLRFQLDAQWRQQ